jgi:hypothetical protein
MSTRIQLFQPEFLRRVCLPAESSRSGTFRLDLEWRGESILK